MNVARPTASATAASTNVMVLLTRIRPRWDSTAAPKPREGGSDARRSGLDVSAPPEDWISASWASGAAGSGLGDPLVEESGVRAPRGEKMFIASGCRAGDDDARDARAPP
jgi:hypothetical protein